MKIQKLQETIRTNCPGNIEQQQGNIIFEGLHENIKMQEFNKKK